MEERAAALWGRIADFEFDEPGTAFTLEHRLARENGWSLAFARRVLHEYRRFLLLSAVAGHPISPSDPVDQAWHLHLTYTRSYWQRLCHETLGFPLHHEPTRGGPGESSKFKDWYARTLASYQRIFGERPPPDLWPPPTPARGTPITHAPRHRRVDLVRHWLIPRPRLAWPTSRAWKSIAAILLGTSAVGCGTLFRVFPFNLPGPSFLPLFVVFAAVVFGLAGLLRWKLRGPVSAPGLFQESADPYLLAYLAGGHARAVQAAIVSLAARQSLRVDGRGGLLAGSTPPAGTHPLEKAVFATLSPREHQTPRSITLATRGLGGILQDDLECRGWWLTDAEARPARAWPLLLALVVPAVAFLRSFQGISRGYASEFIVILGVLSLVLALALFARRPGRTRAGSAILSQQRLAHAEYRRTRTRAAALDAAGDGAPSVLLPLAVGLFGSSVLAGTELDPLRKTLRPGDASPSGCSTSSGCGGGGDGGGGGGGGGSGCGGCGGGGGGD